MPTALNFIKLAWPIYKRNFWQIIGLSLIQLVILLAVILVGALIALGLSQLSGVIVTIFGIVVVIALAGFIFGSYQALIIAAGDGNDTNIGLALKRGWKLMIPVAAVIVVTTIAELVGSILLVVPGLVLMTLFAFSLIEIVTKDQTAFEAIRSSMATVKKAPWFVAQLLFLGLAVPYLIGFLVPILGDLVSVLFFYPIWFIASYLQYKKVKTLQVKQSADAAIIITTIIFVLIWLGTFGYSFASSGTWELPAVQEGQSIEVPGIFERFFGTQVKEN